MRAVVHANTRDTSIRQVVQRPLEEPAAARFEGQAPTSGGAWFMAVSQIHPLSGPPNSPRSRDPA